MAADGVAPAQDGQAAAFGEGVHADDGVVPPVVAVFALPGGNATGDDGAVEGAGELDGARQEGFAANEARHGLQEAEARFGVHARDHFDEGVGVHQAVGVEHDHVGVAAAPAAHEVFDVAGFAADVLCAAAVPDGDGRAFAQDVQCPCFAEPGVGFLRVGDDEDFAARRDGGLADLLCHRQECGVGHRRVFAVNGHDQRHFAAVRVKCGLVAAQRQEAGEAGGGGEGDPVEGEREEDEQHVLQQGAAPVAKGFEHVPGAEAADGKRTAKGDEAREVGAQRGVERWASRRFA